MERKLKAETRTGTGKGLARKLRAQGKVPAVVYGHGAEPLHIAVDARELYHVLHSEAGTNVLVELRVNGQRLLAMPREVQRDHIKGQYLHVDFLRVARDETITLEVPVHLVGESPGVKQGGVIEHHLWSLEVECLPQDVPAAIEADLSRLGMGDSLHVGDLPPSDRYRILTPAEEVIVSVVPPQVLPAEEEAAEAPGAVGTAGGEAQASG
ncbi:MAG TPA: 50S ribosomal protein L25/general stress protein Ctc [Actinomycetota bacterium]|nr:50S ribosomal protein L25/general stress protein Ctc [Actinomycetota bacterium]